MDRVYEITPSNDGLPASELPKIAAYAGLDSVAYTKCVSEHSTKDKVTADFQDGAKAGARGTPYSIIVTKSGEKIPLEGALPYTDVKQIIDQLLK